MRLIVVAVLGVLLAGWSCPAQAQLDTAMTIVTHGVSILPDIIYKVADSLSHAQDVVDCQERKNHLTELNANLNNLIVAKIAFTGSIIEYEQLSAFEQIQRWTEVGSAANLLHKTIDGLTEYARATAMHFSNQPKLSDVYIELQDALGNRKMMIIRNFEQSPPPSPSDIHRLREEAETLEKETQRLRKASQDIATALDRPCAN